MTIDEVREIWRVLAEAKAKTVMETYYAKREESEGGFDHEGLGVYGLYHERAARKKVRLAAQLLKKAGLEVCYESIRKLTGQSLDVIVRNWVPPKGKTEKNESRQP